MNFEEWFNIANPTSWAYRDIIGQPVDPAPRRAPRSVSASANVNPLDETILTSGSITMTLETASGCDGRKHTLYKLDSTNTLTIACTGSETIDGAASITVSGQYCGVVVFSDGTNWNAVGIDAIFMRFLQSGTGAVVRTGQGKLRETVSITDFGASTTASGATNRAAIVAALAAHNYVFAPAGTYPLSGAKINVPAGKVLFGVGSENMQGAGTIFARSAGDYLTYFSTDSTDASFTGITLANFRLSGGGSATWADVSGKYGIESHYPFTRIEGVHIEGSDLYFGNGIRLHNDGGQATMGAWMSSIENTRVVGTDGTNPADNSQIALDLRINGGNIHVSNSNFGYTNVAAHVHEGENVVFENVQCNNIRGGAAAARTKAAVIVGDANSNVHIARIRGFRFNGYMEAVGRAFLFNNCWGAKVCGGYYNALRAFSPSGGSDGFFYITKGGEGVSIENSFIEVSYNLPDGIYSEGPVYESRGNLVFVNSTNSSYVPQTYFGTGPYSSATTANRFNDTGVLLTDTSSTTAITNVIDNGAGLIRVSSTTHGLVTDEFAWIEGVVGVTNINGHLWKVTRIDANTFDCQNSTFAGTYSAGGNVWRPTVTRNTAFVAPTLGVASATSINFGQDALNYYDEGTWTLAVTGWTLGNATVVSTYTRVGNLVRCEFSLTLGGTTTTAAGTITITGLPFNASSTSGMKGSARLDNSGVSYIAGIEVSAATSIRMYYTQAQLATLTAALVTDTAPFAFASGDIIAGSFEYRV